MFWTFLDFGAHAASGVLEASGLSTRARTCDWGAPVYLGRIGFRTEEISYAWAVLNYFGHVQGFGAQDF